MHNVKAYADLLKLTNCLKMLIVTFSEKTSINGCLLRKNTLFMSLLFTFSLSFVAVNLFTCFLFVFFKP